MKGMFLGIRSSQSTRLNIPMVGPFFQLAPDTGTPREGHADLIRKEFNFKQILIILGLNYPKKF